MADELVWVSDFNFRRKFDVASNNAWITVFFTLIFAFNNKIKFDWVVSMTLKTNVFKIEHDIYDIFTNTFNCSEFVSCTLD